MSGPNPSSDTLAQLRNDEQTDLLDAVDRLRTEGFTQELNLPQLIVVGDQSAGKSSVLEAISGVKFPTAETYGTSFATELVIRNKPIEDFSVTIVPAADRNKEETEALGSFTTDEDTSNLDNFAKVVQKAAECIKAQPSTKTTEVACFKDKLVANVHGPKLPPLTLVDLPGIIHNPSGGQGDDDVNTISDLTLSYIRQESSIILAVVSADHQISGQIVLRHARLHDPRGQRTLGIITKPDLVNPRGPMEAQCIQLARNQDKKNYLALGWHILRNRTEMERKRSSEERDAAEAEFFSNKTQHDWYKLDPRDLGVTALRQKLSGILLDAVRGNLPSLLDHVKEGIKECQCNILRLGQPVETDPERRTQLSNAYRGLQRLVEEGLKGTYGDKFFRSQHSQHDDVRKFRACLRRKLDSFADHMRHRGHMFTFDASCGQVDSCPSIFADHSEVESDISMDPIRIPAADAYKQLSEYITRHRGCELPGTLPHNIESDVSQKLCARWPSILESYSQECSNAAEEFIHQAMLHVGPDHVARNLLIHKILPEIETVRISMEAKINEICAPYTSGVTISLNHDIFYRHQVEVVQSMFPSPSWSTRRVGPEEDDTPHNRIAAVEVSKIDGNSLGGGSTQEVLKEEEQQAVNVLIRAATYNRVTRNTLIDNFAILTIEQTLVAGMRKLCTGTDTNSMSYEELEQLTMEPAHIVRERQRNGERLKKLKEILAMLRRHPLTYDHHKEASVLPKLPEDGPRMVSTQAPITPPKSNDPEGYSQHEDKKLQPTLQIHELSPPVTPKPTPNGIKRPVSKYRRGATSPSPVPKHARSHSTYSEVAPGPASVNMSGGKFQSPSDSHVGDEDEEEKREEL